jgi:dihydrofolate synthase / folylpolyglutamate synthase
MVLGVNADKNLTAIMTEIKRFGPKMLIATRSQNAKAMPAESIANEAAKAGLESRVTQNVGDAIGMAREFADANDLVCITGSLYTAGEAREKILSLPVSR